MKRLTLTMVCAATVAITSCSTTQVDNRSGLPTDSDQSQGSNQRSSVNQSFSGCANCGVIVSIDIVPADRTSMSGNNTVLGGIVGSVAQQPSANQMASDPSLSQGSGGLSDHMNRQESYDIKIRMDDGRTVTINQNDLQGLRENAPVRIDHGRIFPR